MTNPNSLGLEVKCINRQAYAPAYFVFRHGKCLKNVKGKAAGTVLALVFFGTYCAGCGESTKSSARIYSTVHSLAFVGIFV
jgi:hypothetical protein